MKTRTIGKKAAMFKPVCKLASRVSSKFSHMHAMRKGHTFLSRNVELLTDVAPHLSEERLNRASPGGPIVRLRARVGSIKHIDTMMEAAEKGCERRCIILI